MKKIVLTKEEKTRSAIDWKKRLIKKTTGNFLIGLLLGIAFMISIIGIAFW